MFSLLFTTIAVTIKRLQDLGFKESDCIKALQATSGRLQASATWLRKNASPVMQAQNSQSWQFAGLEVGRSLITADITTSTLSRSQHLALLSDSLVILVRKFRATLPQNISLRHPENKLKIKKSNNTPKIKANHRPKNIRL